MLDMLHYVCTMSVNYKGLDFACMCAAILCNVASLVL